MQAVHLCVAVHVEFEWAVGHEVQSTVDIGFLVTARGAWQGARCVVPARRGAATVSQNRLALANSVLGNCELIVVCV
jgi:hypothetical protein